MARIIITFESGHQMEFDGITDCVRGLLLGCSPEEIDGIRFQLPQITRIVKGRAWRQWATGEFEREGELDGRGERERTTDQPHEVAAVASQEANP